MALNEQKLFNCARNMEVAVWKLGNDRNAAGENSFCSPTSLTRPTAISPFEREFGRQMGLLDLMAKVVADRNGRGISRLTHGSGHHHFSTCEFFEMKNIVILISGRGSNMEALIAARDAGQAAGQHRCRDQQPSRMPWDLETAAKAGIVTVHYIDHKVL
jgi:hypothetical protein